MTEKYVVYKKADFESLMDESPEADFWGCQLEDAVVIRLQDVFAQSALFAYASSIRTAIEILEATNSEVPEGLGEIADYFMAQGEKAGKYPHRKVPD